MKFKNLDKIKSLESKPIKINIFLEKEIEMIKDLFSNLPKYIFFKKQNIRKKAWLQN